MSGGLVCSCGNRAQWRVLHRGHNHSAFNGYRWTESAYSTVACAGCDRLWRTRAGYVAGLPGHCAHRDTPFFRGVES